MKEYVLYNAINWQFNIVWLHPELVEKGCYTMINGVTILGEL